MRYVPPNTVATINIIISLSLSLSFFLPCVLGGPNIFGYQMFRTQRVGGGGTKKCWDKNFGGVKKCLVQEDLGVHIFWNNNFVG